MDLNSDTFDFEDQFGQELGGFIVTADEIQAVFDRVKSGSDGLAMDIAGNPRVGASFRQQYSAWRNGFLAAYGTFTAGSWWDRNFSGNMDTAERFQNDLAGWQTKYRQVARAAPTSPQAEQVQVGGTTLPGLLQSSTTPLMWIAGIIALVIGFRVYKDLR